MATVTKTIGPSKDYATLSAWVAARAGILGAGDTEIAECYSGGTGVGGCTIIGSIAGGTWTAGTTLITVASGHRHDGTNAGTTGVAFSNSVINISDVPNVTLEYLRCQRAVGFFAAYTATMVAIIQRNLFALSAVQTSPSITVDASTADSVGIPTLNCSIVNNVLYYSSNGGTDCILVTTENNGVDAPAILPKIVNNSMRWISGTTPGVGLDMLFPAPTANCTIICENNVIDGLTNPFLFDRDGQAGVVLSDTFNMSSGPGAASFGMDGTGSQESVGASFLSATDLNLFAGSPALNAGSSGASVYGASPDAIGTVRPEGASWDIGALELLGGGTSTSIIKIIGGLLLSPGFQG